MNTVIEARAIRSYNILDEYFSKELKSLNEGESFIPLYIQFESILDHTKFVIPIVYIKRNFSCILSDPGIILESEDPDKVMEKLCISGRFEYVDETSSTYRYRFIKSTRDDGSMEYVPIQEVGYDIIPNTKDNLVHPIKIRPFLRIETEKGFVNILIP